MDIIKYVNYFLPSSMVLKLQRKFECSIPKVLYEKRSIELTWNMCLADHCKLSYGSLDRPDIGFQTLLDQVGTMAADMSVGDEKMLRPV